MEDLDTWRREILASLGHLCRRCLSSIDQTLRLVMFQLSIVADTSQVKGVEPACLRKLRRLLSLSGSGKHSLDV